MRYKKLNDVNLSDKSVLLRLDLNTPIENGRVTNLERIIRSLPTVKHILEAGARLVIMSHLGRPEENNAFQKEFSLAPVVKEMEKLLNKFSLAGLKSYFLSNLKSSTRFGEASVFSKNLSAFSKNFKMIVKERRFLYFTKRGPILKAKQRRSSSD